jgi:hypothetical protein
VSWAKKVAGQSVEGEYPLNAPLSASIIVDDLPAAVAGKSMWKVSVPGRET